MSNYYTTQIKDMVQGYGFEAEAETKIAECGGNETQLETLYNEVLEMVYGDNGLNGY